MDGYLIAGNYQDIPRLYTAIAEWASCFLFCILMSKNYKRIRLLLISAVTLVIQCLWLELTGQLSTVWWIPCMLIAVAAMYVFLYIILEDTWMVTLYICFKAFLIAEFMASLEWQLESFLLNNNKYSALIRGCLVISIYSIVLLCCFFYERRMKKADVQVEISSKELVSSATIVLCVFFLSNLSFIHQQTPFSSAFVTDVFNIRTLVDLGGLAILYAYQGRIYELNAERELAALNNMLKSQYEHYRNYQDSIDLINIKYHDLKHQIEGLRAELDPERRSVWLDSIENELSSYKPEQQTGNQVLDGVIDGKTSVMRNHKIRFTCVADGKLLNFMHVTDICSIFGNALDNAIEHVIQVKDEDKRLISMKISARNKFVFIEISNYCGQEVIMRDGLPITTKSDKKNHGFGTKSISCSVKKYNGNLNFSQKNGFFTIKILIPMSDN